MHRAGSILLCGGILASALVLVAARFSTASHVKDAESPLAAETLADKVARLEAKVEHLSDREKIQDVYVRYVRGFDRNDAELMQRAFWSDAQINYGHQSNSFDQFVTRHLDVHTRTYSHYGHLITNLSVDLTGDAAHVETYVTRFSTEKDGKAQIVMGRYIDRLDRRNGEWRIAVREFIPVYWGAETHSDIDALFTKDRWSASDCAMGVWNRHDPSYRRPLTGRESKASGPVCAD